MDSYSGFQSSSLVTVPEKLFGRYEPGGSLEELVLHLKSGTNAQVLGEHRAGKTSLFRCCMQRLRLDAPGIVTVYLNYREQHNINDRAKALAYLLASIHASVCASESARIPTLIDVKGTILRRDTDVNSHYEILHNIEREFLISALLKEYLLKILPTYGVGVVVFLDEYEHLLLKTFNAEAGAFFLLRDLSAEPSTASNAPKPFTIALAGTAPWDRLCTAVGSPELNSIGPVIYLGAIGREPFSAMWKRCLLECSPDVKQRVEALSGSLEDIYNLTGGWPFYGKIAGDQCASGRHSEQRLYESLLQHFNVVWAHLTDQERMVLHTGGREVLRQSTITDLINRGILIEVDDYLVPRGELWRRYVIQQAADQSALIKSEPDAFAIQREKLQLMADQVGSLVFEINQMNQLLYGSDVFVSSNQSWKIYQDLKKVTVSEGSFAVFAQAAYHLLFDSTTGLRDELFRPLERLPNAFRRKKRIVRVVDAIRHHFGGAHLTDVPSFNAGGGAMTVKEVLKSYLHKAEMPRDDQYLDLQFGVLADLSAYLVEIRSSLSQ